MVGELVGLGVGSAKEPHTKGKGGLQYWSTQQISVEQNFRLNELVHLEDPFSALELKTMQFPSPRSCVTTLANLIGISFST